ncbi:MAG: ATP-binding protein [Vicinamibacterales bacterium]
MPDEPTWVEAREALEREVAILRRKLERSEENRARLEDQKERNDRLLHGVIAEMEQAQRDLVDRNGALILAQERLKESELRAHHASRAKSEFLARMSHELRTPLNAIIGYCELLLEDPRPPREVEDLGRILSSGRHLLALINDVLDLSRVEAGRVDIRAEPLAIPDFVRDLAAQVAPLVGQRENRFDLDVPADVTSMVTDGTKLRQVLLNLVGNAAKFTRQGTIGLAVRLDAPWVEFIVTDTGIGFDQQKVSTIFEDFGQLAGNQFGGTGLGLAIARRFCSLLGGTIAGEGVEGRGARFTVRLPLDPRREGDVAA